MVWLQGRIFGKQYIKSRGLLPMRYLAVMFVSAFVAAMVAVTLLASPPAEAAGGKVKRCGGGKIFLKDKEKRSFQLHNQERKDRGLKPFCVHPKLLKAARNHSEDMVKRDYFSHNTKGRNETACERVKRYGYRYRLCAENIAWGQGEAGNPGRIMRNWMKSDVHRRNILNGKLRQVGIGTYNGTFKRMDNVTMYTVDFGTPL